MPVETVHRFVPITRVEAWIKLGWLALPSLEGTHHGCFKVHITWRCCCGTEPPIPAGQRASANGPIAKPKFRLVRPQH